MRYVTYDPATGALTGCYMQDVLPEHASCHIEVSDAVRANWPAYRANTARDGVELAAVDMGQLRSAKWEAIKALRDQIKSGGVLVSGHWFHSDDSSRIQQLGLVIMGASVPPVQWKTMSGAFATMSQALAGGIFNAVATLDQAAFANAETHRIAMEASADPANYDISTGWPAVYVGA